MDFKNKNANDLISKNADTAKAAAKAIINSKDIQAFQSLCEKSEFIFDFIKSKIVKNLVQAVTEENFKNLFDFTKIYNRDFEDFIIQSFLKYADEDLTDRMLDFFENGTDEQKSYSAAYFYYINDPLAIEYLNKFTFSDFEPLAENCAAALRKFNDRNIYNKAIEAIQNKETDDFEKYKYINFLVAYGDNKALNILLDCLQYTCLKGFLASSILCLTNFKELVENGHKKQAFHLFDILLEAYPEEVSLETIIDFEIFDFVKHLAWFIKQNEPERPLVKRILLKAKYKFNMISKDDIYTFDVSKNTKEEIHKINNFIDSINIDLFDEIETELNNNNKERVLEALNIILNFKKTNLANHIKEIIKNTDFEDVISEGVKVLRHLGQINIIDTGIVEKIKNENLKAITNSYFKHFKNV